MPTDGSWLEAGEGLQLLRVHEQKDQGENEKSSIRTEITTRKMRDVLAAARPQLELFVNKKDGTVSDDWTPLVKLEPHPGDLPTTIRWHNLAIEERSIDKAAVDAAFKQADSRSGASVQWDI